MSDVEMTRKQKITNDLLDSSSKAVSDWGQGYLETNIPHALDWVMAKFQEVVRNLVVDKPEQESVVLPSMETYLKGIECGEQRKEIAMIYGMQKAGLSKEQIEEILMLSKEAWNPVEKEGLNK